MCLFASRLYTANSRRSCGSSWKKWREKKHFIRFLPQYDIYHSNGYEWNIRISFFFSRWEKSHMALELIHRYVTFCFSPSLLGKFRAWILKISCSSLPVGRTSQLIYLVVQNTVQWVNDVSAQADGEKKTRQRHALFYLI